MNITVKIHDKQLRDLIMVCGQAGRKQLLSVAAKALMVGCRRHIQSAAVTRHATASRLGAPPTQHLRKGAAAMTSGLDGDTGFVDIPIPGFKRVFGPMEIVPRRAPALTIPIAALAYGRRASEIKAMGWKMFVRKNGGNILYGSSNGEVRPLYVLVEHATVPQDRGLLPSDEEMGGMCEQAVDGEVRRILGKAS